MTDAELRAAFETATLEGKALDHRTHVRLAWIYLTEDAAAGPARFTAALRRYTEARGVVQKYHETMTRTWLRLVEVAIERSSIGGSFDALLAASPELADARAPLRHYREATLFGDEARAGWVEPDLAPLP